MAKEKTYPPPEKIALYEKLFATHAGIERKGDTMSYTSLNGHMFSYLANTGVAVIRNLTIWHDVLQRTQSDPGSGSPLPYRCGTCHCSVQTSGAPGW